MKIILPSLGILGCKSVDMNQPTISSFRAVSSMNREPDLLKIQYVQYHCPNLDLSKITYYDLEYLYQVAAFASNLNQVSYDIECPYCKERTHRVYMFGSQDVKVLEKIKVPYTREFDDVVYDFYILSAADFLDCVEDALAADDYQEALTDNIIAAVLGIPRDNVKNVPIRAYLYAHLFHKVTFHGVDLKDQFTCPNEKCQNTLSVKVNLNPLKVLYHSSEELFADYQAIQDKVSFDEFMSFTVSEYKAFVESLS